VSDAARAEIVNSSEILEFGLQASFSAAIPDRLPASLKLGSRRIRCNVQLNGDSLRGCEGR